MLEIFEKGGFMMYPIMASSILALAVIIERLVAIGKTKAISDTEVENLTKQMREENPNQVTKILSSVKSPIYQVAKAIWNTKGNEHAREKAAGIAGDMVLMNLNKRLQWLAIIGSLVPLMGLLGTVLGMIKVFSNVSQAGDVSDISLLAGGIWEALLTTAAGMAVAIPVLIIYHWMNGKVEKIAFDMIRHGETFIATLREMKEFK